MLDRLKGLFSLAMGIRVGDDNYNDPRNTVNQPVSQQYDFGSGTGQANVLSSEEYTIAASATETLTLDDSSLEDMFGNVSNFANVKGIRVSHSPSSDASSITVGGTFTVAFTSGTDQLAISLSTGGAFGITNNQSSYAVGGGETVTLLNNDGVEQAIVSVDLLGA